MVSGIYHRMDAPVNNTTPTRFALVVDDDASFREVVARTLPRLGLGILEAPSVRKAGELIGQQSQVIDLLVVDGMLPDGTGLDLIEMVRANGMDVPIVYVSAFAQDDAELKRRLVGSLRVHSVLSKPNARFGRWSHLNVNLSRLPIRRPGVERASQLTQRWQDRRRAGIGSSRPRTPGDERRRSPRH